MSNFFKRVWKKWTYSVVGLWITLKEEKSIWAFLGTIPVLIGLGIWFNFKYVEWSIVSFVIFTVLSVEVINTALEAAVDTISFQYNVKVKKIKDIASGATLVITVGASIALLLIYIPALLEKL